MSNQKIQISFDVMGNAQEVINNITQQTQGLNTTVNKTTSIFKKFGEKIVIFQGLTEFTKGFKNSIDDLFSSGKTLNASLADFSAITGQTGQGLKQIEEYARQTAKTFGGSAANSIESYKLILSQLNPEIAKVPEALKSMGDSIAILSKTMGGDTVAATEVLTTAMNQFQVSTKDPIAAGKEMTKMMNVMAAAAKEGSAKLPQIKAALEESGKAAKGAGVSFEETNAAIQLLDKAGEKGAEGGIALRNIMTSLSMGRFLPKDVQEELKAAGVNIAALTDQSKSLSERLKPLRNVMDDTALITKIFGEENNNAAIALLSSIDSMDAYKMAITGTNTAQEQAAIVMDSYAEKQARIQAQFEDLKISIFNAVGGIGIWMQTLSGALVPIAQVFPLFMGIGKIFISLRNSIIDYSKNILTSGGFTIWFSQLQNTLQTKLGISKVAFVQFGTATKAANIALVRFAKVGIFSALKGMGAYILSLFSGGAASVTFASIAKISFAKFAFTAGAACKAVGAAIGSIPIIGWIAAAVAGVLFLINKLRDTKAPVEETANVLDQAREAAQSYYAQERMQLDQIFEKLKRTNPQSKERAELVRQLKEAYPELNKQVLDEITNTNNLSNAYNILIENISKRARAKALESTMEENYKQNANIDMALAKAGERDKRFSVEVRNEATIAQRSGKPFKTVEFTSDIAGIEKLLKEITNEDGTTKVDKIRIGNSIFTIKGLQTYVKRSKEIKATAAYLASTTLDSTSTTPAPPTTEGGNPDLTKASDAITGGGKSIKNINIHIENMVRELKNEFSSSKDDPSTAADFNRKLCDVLQTLVNDASHAG